MNTEKQILFSGVFWSFIGQILFMAILFLTNIILARKLTPEQFGQVGIVMFFVLFANVLVESGLGGALVRKIDATKKDYSTVFTFNLALCILIYFLIAGAANYIAQFYENPNLEDIIYVIGLIILLNGFQIVHNAKLIKESLFKRLSTYRVFSVLISSLVGIYLAYVTEAGVWSIVWMQVLNVLLFTLCLNIFHNRFYGLNFHVESFKELYKFGINTTVASLLTSVFDNIYNLVLGKYFSISQTGQFYQGKKLQEVPYKVLNTLLQGPIFSSLSRVQTNTSEFLVFYKKIFQSLLLVSILLTSLIFIFAKEIILLTYGVKWLPAVFYIKFLVVISFFNLLEMYKRVVFKVFNKTKIILKLEILKKSIQTISIFLGIFYESLALLMFGFLITAILSYIFNLLAIKKIVKLDQKQEVLLTLKVIVINLICSGVILILFRYYEFNSLQKLIALLAYLISYFFTIQIFRIANIREDVNSIIILLKKNSIL